ncbi:MAG: UPF0182 family protein, partial [Peptococcaceae bacterium]|nr:UPF0182 family protein [Peptococcaceae bacterium]
FSVVGYGIIPQALQSLLVIPNELNYELPYINNEITYTRYGFGLDKIKEEPYSGTTPITSQDLSRDQATLNNVRLNDPGPLSQTFAQEQGIRLYYKFNDIDVDRYMLNGQERQVMLAAREMSSSDIDPKAQTFVNLRFKYTHGFGVTASLANSVTPDGLPNFIVQDIPPVASYPELNITQPRIYYGELTNDWVITNTTTKEFDYPQGSNNMENTYQGTTGIQLTPFNKFMLSLNHATLRFYLSNEITSNSRILLNRNIMDRVQTLAPFLTYDHDPYLVIAGGKLYWIIDAYTTSGHMPYSDPDSATGTNYIRNSVKVVVDAYNGTVNFYLADKTDPIAQTYAKIFPGFLKDINQMPADLRAHIRYPEDLFSIQTNKLKNFHMLNPTVFYNKEDAWDVASELHTSESQKMQPYYTVMRLPGATKAEYILMIPFTPASSATNKRNNMVAWLGARMDGANYGQLTLFELPKNDEIEGPLQVESQIDQDTTISSQLSLWDQHGSTVIRGNLLTLPIHGNFLYVEPIYLQSDQGAMPEMKKVVVVYMDKVIMSDTLDAGLQSIFGSTGQPAVTPTTPTTAVSPPLSSGQVQNLTNQIDQIKQLLDNMQSQLQALQSQSKTKKP